MKNAHYLIAGLVLLAACVATPEPSPGEVEDTTPFQTIKSFSSSQEIKNYLQENQQESSKSNFGFFGGGMVAMNDMAVRTMAVAESADGAATAPSAAPAAEYSETNVQVQGVDEADFVKNDGKYIYVLSGTVLAIVDAFPADDAEVLSETDIEGTPQQMFVNGDRLVVFSRDWEERITIPEYEFLPVPRSESITRVTIYDISDRSDPEVVNEYEVTGNYFQARMIGDHVYFVTNENVWFYNDILPMPAIREGGEVLVEPRVFYFDNPERNYGFNTVASFDITSDDDTINAKTYLLGQGNTMYVSEENIYITYQKNPPWQWYETNREERFFEAVVLFLPRDVREEIEQIRDSDISKPEQWDKIAAVMQNMYNTRDEDELDELVERIAKAVDEYDVRQEQKLRQTVVHKIAIDAGDIDYVTRGEVPGRVLNQFSMDEHDGKFRIATTTELWNSRSGRIAFNNVYVLDEDLEELGKLEGIAEDETIFSARFMGDRLYMVTFERIDPFFVIDLSEDTPKILGELKIPGFSDYLHPFDENHVIGVGKETSDNQWGGISIKGVKVALFDVSDVSNPTVLDQVEIGDRGTDSEALRDHKAFLFDKERELLVLPIREIVDTSSFDPRRGYVRQRYWQGAYVFTLNEDGFEERGKISHASNEYGDHYWYSSPSAVRRSLYMDDTLYTVSQTEIHAHDLDDLEKISEVDLPYEERKYYPEPYFIDEIAVEEVIAR